MATEAAKVAKDTKDAKSAPATKGTPGAKDAPGSKGAKGDAAPAAETPKKKSKLLLFVIIGVVLAGGGVGGWLALKPKPAEGAVADKPAPAKKVEKGKPPAAPIYFKYDPAFVVNFGGEGSARYLQVMVEAMTRDPVVAEIIKNNEPAVRNDLVLLFSSQDNATLLSSEGKEKLRQSTLEAIRKVVAAEGGDGKLVENVYFTSFVIQ
jgi:flagellar FliL protein